MVKGIIYGLNTGVMIRMPSTALSTEMAGVIIPSPYNRHAAKSPIAARPIPRFFVIFARFIRAVNAITPPSPLLSALKTNVRYLMVTIMISAQNMRERTPRMFSLVTGIA